jgi:hypothetical protein
VLAAVGVVTWIVFCASVTLIFGSGAERYPVDNEADFDKTMFYAGIACFGFGCLVALVLRATGAADRDQESTAAGVGFLAGTAILAFVAGIVLDIAK